MRWGLVKKKIGSIFIRTSTPKNKTKSKRLLTMNIKETKVSFLKSVYIGQRAFVITVSKGGFEANIEEIANDCSAFNACLITGDEKTNPFIYKDSLSELCKNIKKNNPYTKIIIESDGFIQPTGLNTITDLTFLVNVKLNNSGIDYNMRINENSLRWLSKQETIFVFEFINPETDFDELNLLILELELNKNKIYIKPFNDENGIDSNVFYSIMNNGFNVFVEYG